MQIKNLPHSHGRLPDNLLAEMVKCDDLIKQHQIHILKMLAILDRSSHRGLRIAQIIIGKISDQPAGKGRQLRDPRASVIRQDLPQIGRRVVRMKGQAPHLHLPVDRWQEGRRGSRQCPDQRECCVSRAARARVG